MATKTLVHSLWNSGRQQPESGIEEIGECVTAIRNKFEHSDPAVTPDPIAFIYVFAFVLERLTPEAMIRKHRESICEVMGEFAGICIDLDAPSWSYSHKECAEWTSIYLCWCDLEDEQNLCPKLRALIETWNPGWPY